MGKIRDHFERHAIKYIIAGFLAFSGGVIFYEYGPSSRRTFNPAGRTLEYRLPDDFKRMINVSSGGSAGDVMITYETLEGKLVTKEYNKMRMFETDIRWIKPETQEEAKEDF
jgi:hypothetical protein